MEQFARDVGFEELGGVRYLADLVDRAPAAATRTTAARSMTAPVARPDPHRRHSALAGQGDAELSARDQIEAAEQQLRGRDRRVARAS